MFLVPHITILQSFFKHLIPTHTHHFLLACSTFHPQVNISSLNHQPYIAPDLIRLLFDNEGIGTVVCNGESRGWLLILKPSTLEQ